MTDNRTTELLPCPFCGGEPEIRERKVHHTDWFGKDYRLMYRVRCTKCGAAIGGYSPVLFHRDSNGIEHGAGVDWNTRTPEQAIADELNAELGGGNCARCAEDMGRYADSLCDPLKERIAELLRCLENDWHIHASWDGLRKFWCIELTEEGVRMRDAAHAERTCEIEHVKGGAMYDVWRYTCCGYEYAESVSEMGIVQNYCPNCGCKVVGE